LQGNPQPVDPFKSRIKKSKEQKPVEAAHKSPAGKALREDPDAPFDQLVYE